MFTPRRCVCCACCALVLGAAGDLVLLCDDVSWYMHVVVVSHWVEEVRQTDGYICIYTLKYKFMVLGIAVDWEFCSYRSN